MLLYTPDHLPSTPPTRISRRDKKEPFDAVCQRALAAVDVGQVYNRRNQHARYAAFAPQVPWSAPEDVPSRNYTAWGVLKHLGFVNVKHEDFYHGPVLLTGAQGKSLTEQQMQEVKAAQQVYADECEYERCHPSSPYSDYETFPKRKRLGERDHREMKRQRLCIDL